MKYAKLKKIDRKTKEQVGWRFEFRSYNPKTLRYEPVKREALPQYILETQDEEVIKKYCDSQSAEEDAVKHRAKIRAEWRKRFSDFDLLLKEFEKYQKKSAPNSYENDVYYLERYALYWFLSVKDSNNYLNWPIHYAEFKDWLKSVKPLKWNKDKLSLNTQNKIIKALNRFLDMISVAYQKQIDKCPQYSRAELTRVSARDILDEDEINKIQDELKQIRPASHDFFTVLVNTGLRENEALGLCLSFVTRIGGLSSKNFHQSLISHDFGLSI